MKKFLLVIAVFMVTMSVFAHDDSKWEKKYGSDKKWDQKDKCKPEEYGWHGQPGEKNIPTRVAQSFYHEYPYAQNTYWTKDRGNWIVRFNNGATAVFHANGERLYANNGTPTPIYVPAPQSGNVYYPPVAYPSNQNPNHPDPRNYGGAGNKTPSQPGRPDPKNYGGL